MLQKTSGIILRQLKYNDNSLIVDIFTREMGKVAFAVKLSQSRKGAVRRALFQPLNIVAIEFDYREKASLQTLHSITLATPFVSIPLDMGKSSVAMFLAEFLSYVLREEGRNDHLFQFIEQSLMLFDAMESDYANFHLCFMMKMTLFLGISPNVDSYAPGRWFDLRSSCFEQVRPSHSDVISPEMASRFMLLMRMNFENMRAYQFNHRERSECLRHIITYYRLHIPSMPEMKSLDILQEMFA